MRPKPVVLCILDGWGHRLERENNAIALAKAPAFARMMEECPHSLVRTSGLAVGLPEGQMGNSEVGHMNIGAGRVVMQDLPRIDAAVADGSLAHNPGLTRFIAAAQAGRGVVHLVGLLSPGGVHSHQDHIAALAKVLAGAGLTVWVHGFLDGRDTPPKSAQTYVSSFLADVAGLRAVRMGTIGGRYFGMDRDKRWDRVARAYDALVLAEGEHAATPAAAIEDAYAKGITDEFVPPHVLPGYPGMQDGDAVLVANFRADRVRQMLTALLDPAFAGFPRKRVPQLSAIAGMTEYSEWLTERLITLFPAESLSNSLGEIVAGLGLRQLRIAETEKYPHVTYFFNGGRETVFPGEDRVMVESPKVATYDLKPEMSAHEVTAKLVSAIDQGGYDLIVVNYANPDMVGHTGDLAAAIRAVETIDACLAQVWAAVERQN
ncbi:MAG TPA: 2,3-bisphosphoglycerate-independent phosphoglycerate mutase, partial [Alphaproteobacteria bacterium]|nr:2,3-bisphosphoglycerate-independent phosphoglycerate mutase [Alphaproteobacteria bacterium]